MPLVITIRAGDTDPLDINVDATGLDDLTEVDSAVLYMRKDGESANHVDAEALTIPNTANKVVRFDPVNAKVGGGNAFDTAGRYRGYVKITFTDDDESRHPEHDDLVVNVIANLE